MTKLLSSIIGGALGITLAASVGIGISAGANKDFNKTDAADTEVTYTFINKSWHATVDGINKDWTSGKDGSSFSNNGIQVTTTTSGANGTSPVSYTNISKIVLTYNTNSSKGAGTFNIQIGNNSANTVSWAYPKGKKQDGISAFFTVEQTYQTTQTGNVKITVNTTTNSCYLVSCKITSEGETHDTPEGTDVLTSADLAATSSNYTHFSNVSKYTDARYLGCSAKDTRDGAANIQIKSGDKDGYDIGIASSTSGGAIRQVSVKWSSEGSTNTNGRYLTIRGSNTAYTTNTLSTGTIIGTITYQTGDTTGSIDEFNTMDLSYVSIVASSSMYIEEITIVWGEPGENPDPEDLYEYKDDITLNTTGLQHNQSSYEDWSNKKLTSHAIYAGHSSSMNGSIQIRSTKTNTQAYTNRSSGIVSTTSGGHVSKVRVTFSMETATDRIIDVYGKNDAYTSADDLFSGEAKSGTKGYLLGQLQFQNSVTTVELTVDGLYSYVGLRSESGAIYIDKIEIFWGRSTQVPGVDSLRIDNNPTKSTYAVGDSFDPAGLVVQVKFANSSEFEDTNNYALSINYGYTFASSDVGLNNSYTVTVTSLQDNTKTITFSLTLNPAYPVKLIRTSPAIYSSEMKMKLNEGTGRFLAQYTDPASNVEDIRVGSANTVLKTSGDNPSVIDVTSDATDYANQTVVIEYTDQGHTVSYSFVITIDDDLVLDHFDEVPTYIKKDVPSALIEAHYVSFVGEPTVTFQPMEGSGLTVTHNSSIDEYDSELDVGSIFFSLTGSKKGQYSVIVTLRYGNLVSSKSLSILVRDADEGHEGNGEFRRITSTSDITESGRYVITAHVGNNYYGLDGNLTANKYGKDDLTVANDVITSDNYYPITINEVDGGYNLINTVNSVDYYIGHETGKTNMTESNDTHFVWTIDYAESSTGGTFQIASDDARAIIFRAGESYNVFRSYATKNANGTEYFNVELFKYYAEDEEEEQENEAFELVKSFVDNYMHMDDISISDTSDTGACRGEGGYYLTAKAAWNTLVTSYTGEQDLQALFEEKFPDAYERYITWAEKNGDTQPFTGSTIVKASSSTSFLTDNAGALSITVISLAIVGITTLGGYFFFRKKKEM